MRPVAQVHDESALNGGLSHDGHAGDASTGLHFNAWTSKITKKVKRAKKIKTLEFMLKSNFWRAQNEKNFLIAWR